MLLLYDTCIIIVTSFPQYQARIRLTCTDEAAATICIWYALTIRSWGKPLWSLCLLHVHISYVHVSYMHDIPTASQYLYYNCTTAVLCKQISYIIHGGRVYQHTTPALAQKEPHRVIMRFGTLDKRQYFKLPSTGHYRVEKPNAAQYG